ncbi:dTMP kinase [Natronococcus pandeyae]|uniref:Probable thymidylate kinase n=1 Tax=Natronococcus pandeyae TaxID=2055836 RepID=A0A8J8TS09_9EURY|nr:dTMP kinase [Natronococcus pandeyae]TYL40103.1 dTMP kinase [Natronococcus pandeyae]
MLVTLEGLDGSGKTTVWEALHDVYPDATFTTEPTSGETGSWYGEAVYRSIEDDGADPLAELFLYTADHADHLSRVIEPALERDDLVISDRYSDSRYAYQGATLAEDGRITRPLEYVVGIHRAFSIEPDLTIYLDLDPETAAARAGTTNKFERAEYLTSVRDNYERLIDRDPARFVRVDATQPPEVVLERVEDVLASALEEDEADTGDE